MLVPKNFECRFKLSCIFLFNIGKTAPEEARKMFAIYRKTGGARHSGMASHTTTANGRTGCALKCFQSKTCKEWDFKPEDSTCQLFDTKSDLVTNTEYDSYTNREL